MMNPHAVFVIATLRRRGNLRGVAVTLHLSKAHGQHIMEREQR